MSFASYGLVVHERTVQALRAGRVYIVLVAVGEVLLFAALALAAQAAGSIEFEVVRPALAGAELRDWIVGLTLLGFGIKAGVIGLHVWLPLAHPVAPTPASAVLSGAMIAAGLLGWLRLLPLGEMALPGWGGALLVAGVMAIFYAALVGLSQRNPKTVLAYSSISAMGVMTAAVGLGLLAPESWPYLLAAILIYALQHGLAKGALFLGVGVAATHPLSSGRRRLLIAGLLLSALSLAGAPLTSGMIAKNLLKAQAAEVALPWGDWLQVLLPWSSVATGLLMARFLTLVWRRHKSVTEVQRTPATMWLSWSALLVVVVLSPWFLPYADGHDQWTVKAMIGALWPVVLAAGLGAGVGLAAANLAISWPFSIPPGDLLALVESRLSSALAFARAFGFETLPEWRSSFRAGWHRIRDRSGPWFVVVLDGGENRLARWAVATTLLLVLGMVLVFLAAS
jgi:formate hydrogenlyase subunit 3/multisubunit Na+/H+ antiporter MnhD subunit